MSEASSGFTPPEMLLKECLQAVVDTTADGVIHWNRDRVIEFWNPAAEQLLGYNAREIIGSPTSRLVPPERQAHESSLQERILKGESSDQLPLMRLHRDGQRIGMSVSISPLHSPDGQVVGATEVFRSLGRPAELEETFEAIVRSSDDAIVAKDINGIIRSWNSGAERVFGYTAEEMIGMPVTMLIPADRPNEEVQILSRIRSGERVDHFETKRVRKDGRIIDVSVTISPIKDRTGRVIGASKIARDVTLAKNSVKEREMLLQSEQAARREAERTSRVKDEFLATLSHELRTPLNAILGWAHVLRAQRFDEKELREGLETIERNARVQTQLIEDLLDMSRIISGKLRLDIQHVDLTSVINDAVQSAAPAADAKDIRLQKILDTRAGPVNGDAGRLQQIVWNLLTNAIKFTPRGGNVQIHLKRNRSHVEIIVADSGQGISPDFLPQLFTRFSQSDSSTKRAHGGLGLGLAIVRHLVELHGGAVHGTSQGEGKGATFTVELPVSAVYRPEPDTPSKPNENLRPELQVNLAGITVLVVDDEADACRLVQRVLEDRGATVQTARSAAEAFAKLQDRRPDLLLSDIGMPGEDGYSLLERVRSLPPNEGGKTPAVALTAFARSEDRQRALLAGFRMHLPKPIEPAELVAVVASITGSASRGFGSSTDLQ